MYDRIYFLMLHDWCRRSIEKVMSAIRKTLCSQPLILFLSSVSRCFASVKLLVTKRYYWHWFGSWFLKFSFFGGILEESRCIFGSLITLGVLESVKTSNNLFVTTVWFLCLINAFKKKND